jgi:L-ascorbate metabolism protein UlaG (beta-lactamase superfamily)
MTISWHGLYTMKITTPAATLVLDPHPKTGRHANFRGKASIVALTNPAEPSMSYLEGIQENPVLINGPGEYSISDITLHAQGWHGGDGTERTVQRWHIENVVIVHLGALNRTLTPAELQKLEQTDIDILFLPIGTTEDSRQVALSLLTTLEPRVVIPINYDSVDGFAKEMGVSSKEAQPKLAISRRKLPAEGMETVILTA